MPCASNISRDNATALFALHRNPDSGSPLAWIDEPLQRGQELGMNLDLIPTTSATAPHVYDVVGRCAVTQLVAPSLDGVQCQTRCSRHGRKTAAPERLRFCARPQPRHSLVHRALEGVELRADESL